MIDVRVQGLGLIRRALYAMSSRKTKEKALNAIGAYLQAQAQARFETETGPDGRRWHALSRRTIQRGIRASDVGRDGRLNARGARRISMRKILTDTGRLKSSISYRLNGTSSVSVGSDLVYANIHQFGGSHIPARPFLGLAAGDEQHIRDLVISVMRF